jgi:S-adenosylmethionine synthetase
MFEKVNPGHPDKVADRIAGAIVDVAYQMERDPKIAVEVLIGHRVCHIITESSVKIPYDVVTNIVSRISGCPNMNVIYDHVTQDEHLANNQKGTVRCGDNGIFKGVPTTHEQKKLSDIARSIYSNYLSDGKYIINDDELILCQSNAGDELSAEFPTATVNPLGYWTGGTDVDTGATNRKLGSDMGDAVTGGGLHGKDLSKADVSVNIFAHLLAQSTGETVSLCCAIGDETVGGIPYTDIVEKAREYIKSVGGFEKFAEWGLI